MTTKDHACHVIGPQSEAKTALPPGIVAATVSRGVGTRGDTWATHLAVTWL